MKRYLLHSWIGTALLASLLASGCGHSRRHCHCASADCCSPVSGRIVLLPVAPAKPKEVVAAKHVEPPPAEAVEVTMTYPAPEGSSAGSVTGTVILTAAEAKAMGIRPGYTPGAMFVPAPPREEAVAVETPAAEQAEKPHQPAPTFLPADIAK